MKQKIIKEIKLASERFSKFWSENSIEPLTMFFPFKGNNYRKEYQRLLEGKAGSQIETERAETRGGVALLVSIVKILVFFIINITALDSIENIQSEQAIVRNLEYVKLLLPSVYSAIEGYFGMKLLAAPRYQEQVQPTEEQN